MARHVRRWVSARVGHQIWCKRRVCTRARSRSREASRVTMTRRELGNESLTDTICSVILQTGFFSCHEWQPLRAALRRYGPLLTGGDINISPSRARECEGRMFGKLMAVTHGILERVGDVVAPVQRAAGAFGLNIPFWERLKSVLWRLNYRLSRDSCWSARK